MLAQRGVGQPMPKKDVWLRKKPDLYLEKLEIIKSFKNKLNKSFVDSFQKYDLYHKLNIYLNPYNKFQIKAYLRNNLILNLIFIQKFKEFKYYDNDFYLNLNLLPTTFSEYFKSLKIQLYKEAIKNNLYTYALVSNLLECVRNTSLSSSARDSRGLYKDAATHTSPFSLLPSTFWAGPGRAGESPFLALAGDQEEKQARNNIRIDPTPGDAEALSKFEFLKKLQNLLENYTITALKQEKANILNNNKKQAPKARGGVRNPELFNSLFEYNNLINNIFYNLYDEFKYGESTGLVNKVIYKNVKKLVSESKRVNRNKGIDKFDYFIQDYSNDPK